jgi:Fur family transcriptional regulator, peroxide stress response regulator
MKRAPAMSKAAIKQHEEEFRRLCREKSIPFTPQRRIVLQAVLELGSHPTADEVYASPIVRKAGVSRATVYRNLENLAQLGAIIKVSHMGAAIRYDGQRELHHHFVCLRCNKITDIAGAKLDAIPMPNAGDLGFVVKDFRVQVSGLCRNCLTDKTKTQ